MKYPGIDTLVYEMEVIETKAIKPSCDKWNPSMKNSSMKSWEYGFSILKKKREIFAIFHFNNQILEKTVTEPIQHELNNDDDYENNE